MPLRAAGVAVGLALSAAGAARAQVAIDYVPVGNPGNAVDPTTGFGAVAQPYLIGRTEVTNAQYAAFLNAKAASDPLELYSSSMGSDARDGIIRSGNSGSFTYAVKPGRGNNPVIYVSFYDTLRFANWLNNGQGNADTETGAYTLSGGTPTPSNGDSITRNAGARVFLPSENEWYKAAYHQPVAQGGDADSYWLYPTGTNDVMKSDQPPGDPSIATNVGNFLQNDGQSNGFDDGYAVTGTPSFDGFQNYLTDVGAYAGADSFYGTFDQGGNVFEWNEVLISESARGIRGGSWFNDFNVLRADGRLAGDVPSVEGTDIGFRLASIPEPASGIIWLTLAAATLGRRARCA
jgi:formylglycine-generating enzyme required for sulfatase activity